MNKNSCKAAESAAGAANFAHRMRSFLSAQAGKAACKQALFLSVADM